MAVYRTLLLRSRRAEDVAPYRKLFIICMLDNYRSVEIFPRESQPYATVEEPTGNSEEPYWGKWASPRCDG
jgi:hypothetical protein